MIYREFVPSPALREIVKNYWYVLDPVGNDELEKKFRISPSGYPELIFHFRNRMRIYDNGNDHFHMPPNLLAGQVTSPVHLQYTGELETLCIKFYPCGIYRLFGIPGNELAGNALEFNLLLNSEASEIHEKLFESKKLEDKIKYVDEFLLKKIKRNNPKVMGIEYAIRQMHMSRGNIPVKQLSDDAGIHIRKFQRDFHEVVGLSPKGFNKILRFNNSYTLITAGEIKSTQDIVYKCGYYDQSHFINDFKIFTGQTPTEYFKDNNRINKLFLGWKEN